MENENNTAGPEKKPANYIKEIMQWVEAVLVAVVIALLIRGFVFEPVQVVGQSMQNTFHTGERLIAYKLGYFFSPPKYGDIIVLEYKEGLVKYLPIPDPSEIDYIKRVIGVPGDYIDLKDGAVYVNNKKLDEPYAVGNTFKQVITFPVRVPKDNVFVLGDNRQNSSDGRTIGMVPYKKVKGKAVFRMWPLSKFGSVYK